MSAGKGVAEKASRLYSRLSSQTSIAQVSPNLNAVPFRKTINWQDSNAQQFFFTQSEGKS